MLRMLLLMPRLIFHHMRAVYELRNRGAQAFKETNQTTPKPELKVKKCYRSLISIQACIISIYGAIYRGMYIIDARIHTYTHAYIDTTPQRQIRGRVSLAGMLI